MLVKIKRVLTRINPNLTAVCPEKVFDYFFNVRKKIVKIGPQN